MPKHLPTILTIIAVIFSTVSFILIPSSDGEDWVHFWDNFEIKQLLIVLAIISTSGLLLGTFLFRNRNYLERIKFTLPIAFILFNLYFSYKTADSYYGLSEYYNYFSAKEDLKNENVQVLTAGQFAEIDSEQTTKAKDSLRQLFGFKLLDAGVYSNGLRRYNEVMEDYLTKKNGKDWEKRLQLKIDSVDKAHKEKKIP